MKIEFKTSTSTAGDEAKVLSDIMTDGKKVGWVIEQPGKGFIAVLGSYLGYGKQFPGYRDTVEETMNEVREYLKTVPYVDPTFAPSDHLGVLGESIPEDKQEEAA